MAEHLQMYGELADWFHLLTPPDEYAEEAAFYRQTLESAARRPVVDVLELGSGGGNNASHLKAHWRMTLVDLAPQMLRLSRGLNPALPHHVGDMRTFRIDETFDGVFVHDACSYLQTVEDLAATARTCAAHLRPGGAALLAPDYTAETYPGATDCGGHDAADGDRAMRYLEWSWDPDPTDGLVNTEMVYVLRQGGQVRTVSERHVVNAFPQARWLQALQDAGLVASMVPFEHTDHPYPLVVFVGVKP